MSDTTCPDCDSRLMFGDVRVVCWVCDYDVPVSHYHTCEGCQFIFPEGEMVEAYRDGYYAFYCGQCS